MVHSFKPQLENLNNIIKSASTVLSLLWESMHIQLINMEKYYPKVDDEKFIENEEFSRNIKTNKHIDSQCQMNKTQEFWYNKVNSD